MSTSSHENGLPQCLSIIPPEFWGKWAIHLLILIITEHGLHSGKESSQAEHPGCFQEDTIACVNENIWGNQWNFLQICLYSHIFLGKVKSEKYEWKCQQ